MRSRKRKIFLELVDEQEQRRVAQGWRLANYLREAKRSEAQGGFHVFGPGRIGGGRADDLGHGQRPRQGPHRAVAGPHLRHSPAAAGLRHHAGEQRRNDPALISEDLPQPEGPVTAMKRCRCSRPSSSSICRSRPKKRSDSSSRKGRSPG